MSGTRRLRSVTPQQAGRDNDAEMAARYGGRPQPGSGATDRFKLDWKLGEILVEAKKTTHQSYRLTADELRKAQAGAGGPGGRGEHMVMAIDMQGFPDDVFIVPGELMRALLAGEVQAPVKTGVGDKRAARLAAAARR